MEAWRKVWREGLAPAISTHALDELRRALVRDDSRLCQHGTTTPPPCALFGEADVEAACALGYCGWRGEGLGTVGEVEEYFNRLCAAAEDALNERAVCRYFLNWFDETPRTLMRRQLFAEIDLELRRRHWPARRSSMPARKSA